MECACSPQSGRQAHSITSAPPRRSYNDKWRHPRSARTGNSGHCRILARDRLSAFVESPGGISPPGDCGIRPEMVAAVSMMFRVPMPNSSLHLTDKVEAALLNQVPKIADPVSY